MHRFVQHAGRLYLPTIVLGELYAWAYRRSDPMPLVTVIENDLLRDIVVLPFDEPCAKEFGQLRGTLMRQGISVSRLDLMIGSVALIALWILRPLPGAAGAWHASWRGRLWSANGCFASAELT